MLLTIIYVFSWITKQTAIIFIPQWLTDFNKQDKSVSSAVKTETLNIVQLISSL
jgi:hypothetical protein